MFIDKPILRARAEERTRVIERSQVSHSYKSLTSSQQNVAHVGLARNLKALSSEKAKTGSIQVAAAGHSIPASSNETHPAINKEGGSLRAESRGQQQSATDKGKSLDGRSHPSQGRTASKLDRRALKEFEDAMELRGDRKVQKYMLDHQLQDQRLMSNQELARHEYQMVGAKGSLSNASMKQPGAVRRDSSDPQGFRQPSAEGEDALSGADENKNELIKQFGRQKGREYYGAIKELEEFLDPNVLQDKDFQFNQKTKEEIASVESNLLSQNKSKLSSIERSRHDQKGSTLRSRHGQHIMSNQRYDESLLGPATAAGTDFGGLAQGSAASVSKGPHTGLPEKYPSSFHNSSRQHPYAHLSHEHNISSQNHFDANAFRQQRAQRSHDNTDIENTHSDTAGVASAGAFPGQNLQGYINMELAPPTSLDHFYPNPIPQQFKNPLSLAPLKPRKPGKSKSKTRQRRGVGHGSVHQTLEEQQLMNMRLQMQTQGGRRLLDHAQGSPRRRALALHAYGYVEGLGAGQPYPEPVNRLSAQKIAQRSNAQRLIYDQQRSFIGNAISQSTSAEHQALAAWHSRNQDDKLKYSVFQDNRASNQSAVMGLAGLGTSQTSTGDRQSSHLRNTVGRSDKHTLRQPSVRNQEYLTTRSGVLPSQTNETLPFISGRQPNVQSSGMMSSGAATGAGGQDAAMASHDSRNVLDASGMPPPSVFHTGQSTEIPGMLGGAATPTAIATMASFAHDAQLTPHAQKLLYRPMAANLSYQNPQDRRHVSTGREGLIKKGGFYHNQPGLGYGTGKIVLKKINHFFDNKKINKLYRNQSKRRGEQWKMEHGPLLYHRPLVYEGRVRQGSGSGATDRKASGHARKTSGQARETRMSSKSRADAAAGPTSKRHEGSGPRLHMIKQASPKSLKKATQKIYAQATAQRQGKGARLPNATEQSRDATTANASVGPVLLSRQSHGMGQDRVASQDLPDQAAQAGRVPHTQQVQKRSKAGSKHISVSGRDPSTPAMADAGQDSKHRTHTQVQTTDTEEVIVPPGQKTAPIRTEGARSGVGSQHRSQKAVRPGGGSGDYQPVDEAHMGIGSDGSYFPGPGQDQQINISIKNKALNYQTKRKAGAVLLQHEGPPPGKRASVNVPRAGANASGGSGPTSASRKGIHTAPRASSKRPMQKQQWQDQSPVQTQAQLPLATYSQPQGRPAGLAGTHSLSRKDKNLLTYINKKMKPGETSQILFNNAASYDAHMMSLTHPAGPRPLYLQYEAAAEKNYELAYLKTKKGAKGKKKPTIEGARNKSAPKRDLKKQADVARSLPSHTVLNKLVQGRGTRASSKGGRNTREGDYHSQAPRSGEPKRAGTRSSYIQPQPLHSLRSGEHDESQQLPVDTTERQPSRVSGKRSRKKVRSRVGNRAATINAAGSKKKAATTRPVERKRVPGEQRSATADNRMILPGQVSLPSNSSIFRGQLQDAAGLHESRSKRSQERPRSAESEFSAHSAVLSEVNRRLRRHRRNKRKMVNLDKRHLRELKRPEAAGDQSLYVPEGMASNPKKALDMLSVSSRPRPLDRMYPMRTTSAKSTMRRGLNYKFQLQDLGKYSQKLRYRDINWKIKLTALGKVIPDVTTRKKILMRGSHFNTLLKLLKQTDWARTPIYHQFLRNGRWKHEDDQIYSEIELQYNISYLNKIDNNDKPLQPEESKVILDKYYKKTMHTLEVLMNQLNMMYYLEKIRLMFADQEPTVAQLTKLMSRCLKLYQQMDQFIKIFKLIDKKEKLDRQDKKDATLTKRLLVTIKLLLKENPVLPVSFIYKGACLLEQLRSYQKEMGIEEEDEPIHSPAKQNSKSRSRRRRDTDRGDKDSLDMNKTFTSMGSRDMPGLSPDPKDCSRILDSESVADSLMAGV